MIRPAHDLVTVVFALVLGTLTIPAAGQGWGETFTYQGRLTENGQPYSGGTADLTFGLFNVASGGAALGTVESPSHPVQDDGEFNIDLFFGADRFEGAQRWLEIVVNGEVLSPRRPIMPAPYAIYALKGAWPWSTSGSSVFYTGGNVGVGTSTPSHPLDVNGWASVDVLEIRGGADLSERFDVTTPGTTPKPGMVVCIDPLNPGKLTLSGLAYDRKVAGVISGAGGIGPGLLVGQRGSAADGAHPVALTGRVYGLCDASYGPIEPGDLLTTSNTPGHAMRAGDLDRARGAIIGKAMTGLDDGRGLVLILVTLQ